MEHNFTSNHKYVENSTFSFTCNVHRFRLLISVVAYYCACIRSSLNYAYAISSCTCKKNKTRRKKINEAQSNAHDDTENSTPANESTSLLIGDSMIKNIQGTRLGKAVGHRVVVKSFSGATTKVMKDYLKPNLELSPDQVILHVGTNDLKSKEPQQVAGSVVDLARQIENSSDATVIISELVSRRDRFNEAVKTVNKQLKFYCRQNGWKFIQHQNISEKELNKGGLHLNFKGNQQFFKNFQMSLG